MKPTSPQNKAWQIEHLKACTEAFDNAGEDFDFACCGVAPEGFNKNQLDVMRQALQSYASTAASRLFRKLNPQPK